MYRVHQALLYYKDSQEGRDEIKNLFLIDQADVEIIKLNFKGMFIDISIKQVIRQSSLLFLRLEGSVLWTLWTVWRNLSKKTDCSRNQFYF